MGEAEAEQFYEKTLLSVALRTIHELYEAIYNGAVETILVTGYTPGNRGDVQDEFGDDARCIFRICAESSVFRNISISDENVEDVLEQLGIERVERFTDQSEELQVD